MQPAIDLSPVRAQFPALLETDAHNRPYVFFDGPGGTQVPQTVIEAMADYFVRANANKGGYFLTSQRNEQIIHQAHEAMADFLNAPSPAEIVFGPNMTTLTYSLSRSIGRLLKPGDEVIVTRLDHDANISPWLALEEQGVTVKWADFDIEDCRLDLDHLSSLLTSKTKLVAVGYASNAVGTINPVARIAALAHGAGAWLWVDAVHFAPHGPIDVQALGCDFLVCSAYKFFGPHVGVLWGKLELLEQLPAYQVRPAPQQAPYKFETGTQNQEGMAGVVATVEYLARLGQTYGGAFEAQLSRYEKRRRDLKQAMEAIRAYERELFTTLLAGLETVPGLKIYGISQPSEFEERCPTVAFTRDGFTPAQIAAYLGEQGIFVWSGNYYALSVTERLGLEASGGMVRVGLAHYNTKAEVDRLIAALHDM
ncbi:MAG TPA: cysteine desulfurase-like protein [Anaerolineae bacterium]|nr:cysteine desulfurase-like protein [Anaerolineae bacterium]HMR67380.1 cysteine desulfurase-like protein [Anaerolineae bacterium]